tara:strand:- start:1112 stop:1234 length:123 start_codon:yes stop_codon:yes gene_type:complete
MVLFVVNVVVDLIRFLRQNVTKYDSPLKKNKRKKNAKQCT